MLRKRILRGGIRSAGYDAARRTLDVEFDTRRIMRVEGIGREAAERFFKSDSPMHYWKDVLEESFSVREISAQEAQRADDASTEQDSRKTLDDLKRLFGEK